MVPTRTAALALGASVGLLGAAVWTYRWRRRRPVRIPIPVVPCGLLEAVRELTSPLLPHFLLRISREVGGSIIRLRVPMNDRYYVLHPDLYHAILGDRTHDKPKLLKAFNNLVKGRPTIFSAFTSSASWQINRKRVAHAFAPTHLASMVPPFEGALARFYDVLDAHATAGTPMDINHLLLWLTLDFVGLSAFEYHLHAFSGGEDSEGRRFVRELEIGLDEFVGKQLTMPWRRYMFWNAEVRRAQQAADWMMALALRIIRQYRSTRTPEEIANSPSILAQLLRNDNYPDDEARAAEVIVFLIGGHDTTANTLAWVLYDLARTPIVQSQLQTEVDALYAEDTHPSLSELTQPSLLNRCIRESMRLWPVAAMGTSRVLSHDIGFEGMTIPRGAWASIPFHAVFRPAWLPETDEFRPDRWLHPDPKLEALFIPFSAGLRNCVAQNLAMVELRVALAGIMRRFSFRLVQEPEQYGCFTMRPKGLLLAAQRRKEV